MATTLNNQISALATQVGTDIKQIIANVGDLSQMTTTQKASLVVALNELKANLKDVADSVSATIDDSAIHSDHTWSSSKINSTITAAINALVNGAPTTLDTLQELASAIENNKDAISALQTIAAGHVKYNEAQQLTAEQQAQARTNIGASAASDLTTLQGTVTTLSGTVSKNTASIGKNTASIGTLTSLTTATQTDLVSAINEVKTTADGAASSAQKAQSTATAAQAAATAAQSSADAAQSSVNTLSANVGDTQTDFVAVYTAARNGTTAS